MKRSKFGLQHNIYGAYIPGKFCAIVARQASALEKILRRFGDEATRMGRYGSSQQQAALFHELIAEAEHVLAEEAQQYVALESEIATFRQEHQDILELPSDAARRLNAMDHVNEVLHANLAVARRVLTVMGQGIGNMQG